MSKHLLYHKYYKKANITSVARAGFTIVELLIVVVVIAILATITVVAYNGVTGQAKLSVLESDLSTAAKKLQLSRVETGVFPAIGPQNTGTTVFQYTRTNSTFCLAVTSTQYPGKSFYATESGSIAEGGCPVPLMQGFTQSQCAALTVYTGSNNDAVITLRDPRGAPQSYPVAKLADGNCWMLSNLKLGSVSTATTLTSADTNTTAATFTLPQLVTTSTAELDSPVAYGPVPGDTGAGATNYGYLYNWPAATAGATRSTNPANSGNAQHSICPANWRMPTAGSVTRDMPKLDIAFGGTGAASSSGPSRLQWQQTGAFRTVNSGFWSAGFAYQGVSGYLWSSSTLLGGATEAYVGLSLSSTAIYPGTSNSVRSTGFAVRCLLN